MALSYSPWFNPRKVLEEVEKLVYNDHDRKSDGSWTLQEIRDSLMQTNQLGLPQGQGGFDDALRATLAKLCEEGKLAMGAGGQQPYRLAVPPWFGPQAVLQEVERLVFSSDNNKAAVGWTCKQIKVSLIQTHPQQEREKTLDQRSFNVFLRATVSRLCQMGDLKVVGVGKKKRYTLSDDDVTPPYLPPWFGSETVLKAVGERDDVVWWGSTWEEIRDSLMRTHQQHPPLPPDFETVLRTMLFVLRQRGHLRTGSSGPGHYVRLDAPALVEPNPIHIPDHLWFYYLGYKLGARDGLHEDKLWTKDYLHAVKHVNALPWFGPRTVLEQMERLVVNDNGNADAGWTLEQIKDSLMHTHQHQNQQEPPQEHLDDAVWETLVTLHKRGNVMRMEVGAHEHRRYTLSYEPPSLPPWFGPEAVLQAVGLLDNDNDNAGGSTWAQIMDSLMRTHQLKPPPKFKTLLVGFLELLRQRGYLARGAGGRQHYTRQQAPALVEPNPPDNLWCYYLGYKLGVLRRLGPRPPAQVDMPRDVGLRHRRGKQSAINPGNEWIITNTETEVGLTPAERLRQGVEESSRSSDRATAAAQYRVAVSPSQPSHGASYNDANDDIEWQAPRNNQQARTQEKDAGQQTEQQRMWYMIWRLCFSLFGHGILFALSFIPGFGEETSGHDEEKTSKKWLKWVVMNLIAPTVLLVAMVIIQTFFVDLEDISRDKDCVKRCKIVNVATIACSKIVYFAISEAPADVTARAIIAHVVAFLIDMGGAIYLYLNHSCLDQDNIG